MKAEGQQSKFQFRRLLKLGPKGKGPSKEQKQLPTPPHSLSISSGSDSQPVSSGDPIIFEEAHDLEKKYGNFGEIIGDGGYGTVQALTNPDTGLIVAVKKFRIRHPVEAEKAYAKKITAEYTIGSMLRHGNIIETLDLVKECDSWYQVMEYAPFGLFESVATGTMTSAEIHCTFAQILEGTNYLHRMGFAHRDLKLENVVVNPAGIMKLIDFGSAIIYRHPSSDKILLSHGYVGSEPYLAPEVLTGAAYDPRAVDVWSLAMIYCCMILKRFPWKIAHKSDASFRRFSTSQPVASSPESMTPALELMECPTTPIETSFTDPELMGRWILLRHLPRKSRAIIGGMLILDPNRRLPLHQVMQDPWTREIPVCSQDVDGVVHRGEGHEHTLASIDSLLAD